MIINRVRDSFREWTCGVVLLQGEILISGLGWIFIEFFKKFFTERFRMAAMSNKSNYVEKHVELCCLACTNSSVSSVQLSTTTMPGDRMSFPYRSGTPCTYWKHTRVRWQKLNWKIGVFWGNCIPFLFVTFSCCQVVDWKLKQMKARVVDELVNK